MIIWPKQLDTINDLVNERVSSVEITPQKYGLRAVVSFKDGTFIIRDIDIDGKNS